MDTRNKNKPINNLLFKGNVFLLTSLETFSSGADCAMLFKDYKIGTIVGQETGGWPTSYGDKHFFVLPKTKMNAGVSFKYFIRPSMVDNKKGVLPDITVDYSVQDILSEKDLELQYVLNLINKKSSR